MRPCSPARRIGVRSISTDRLIQRSTEMQTTFAPSWLARLASVVTLTFTKRTAELDRAVHRDAARLPGKAEQEQACVPPARPRVSAPESDDGILNARIGPL